MTLKPAPQKFIKIVKQIAHAYRMDLSAKSNHLRLENPPYLPLVIEKIDTNWISVAHYYTQNGDLMADPEIVFRVVEVGNYLKAASLKDHQTYWIPTEITQAPLGIYSRLAWFDEKGDICKFSRKQREVASFCSIWADNLKVQCWQHRSQPVKGVEATSNSFTPRQATAS